MGHLICLGVQMHAYTLRVQTPILYWMVQDNMSDYKQLWQ